MDLNSIDEINAYNNGDGSFCIDIFLSDAQGNRVTVKMPRATLDLSLTSGYDMAAEMELELKGTMVRC